MAFARRGEGERFAYNLGRLKVRWLGEGGGRRRRRRADHAVAQARLQTGFIAPQFHLAVIPDHRLFHRRRAPGAAQAASAAGACCAASPTCAPATSSSTRTTGSPASPALTPRRWPASPATTCTWSTRALTACSCPSTSWPRSAATSAAGGAHPPLSKLGGTRWDTIKARARRAAQELAGELLNLYAERKRRAGPRLPARHRLAAGVRGRVPVHRDPRPARRDRVRQGRHGGAAADGPADLRRRRLRQDRGGAAGGVQGGPGRQAGDAAGADHDPRPAALRHLLRAAEGLPGDDRARLALPARRRAEGGGGAVRRAARWTS